jgi:hypothetical protein
MHRIAVPVAIAAVLIAGPAQGSRGPETKSDETISREHRTVERESKTRRHRPLDRSRRVRQADSPSPRPQSPPVSTFANLISPVDIPPLKLDEYVPGANAPDLLDGALDYLVASVVDPGGTMERQGIRTSIERLHPAFVIRLAKAVQDARASGIPAFVFSAYRPPALGVGGYANKFASAHAYGLAADMGGIGEACSSAAKEWKAIANRNGLFIPYGACNGAEFNHVQLMEEHGEQFVGEHPKMRKSIDSDGPIDLLAMWIESGIDLIVGKITPIVEGEPHYAERRRKLYAERRHHERVRYAHGRRQHYASR